MKYRNSIALVTQRLRDMKRRQAQHTVISNPSGFFAHRMCQNKAVLPGIELAKEPLPHASKEQKSSVKPLEIGDVVRLYQALCRVIRVGAARSDIEHPASRRLRDGGE
ncbi:hypothetical protein GCM10022631_14320 [Deinococcus rubellus]|uniref:hypothetical protein n=1 Tax=Deinococcus rubellus TaxID=1889240 RepID=UPI0031EF6515